MTALITSYKRGFYRGARTEETTHEPNVEVREVPDEGHAFVELIIPAPERLTQHELATLGQRVRPFASCRLPKPAVYVQV